jgi:hypothetical protein
MQSTPAAAGLSNGSVEWLDPGEGVEADDALPVALAALDEDNPGVLAGGAVVPGAALAGGTFLALTAEPAAAVTLAAFSGPTGPRPRLFDDQGRMFVLHAEQ